jgi:prepilin-type N-terminal cleavage/methylation domain-containing protein
MVGQYQSLSFRRARSRGFTLLEAIVATTILGFGILGAAIAIRIVNSSVQSSRQLEGATNLARAKLDSAIAEPNRTSASRGNSDIYTWEISRASAGGMSDDPLAIARVTVRWLDHSVSREFVLARAYLRQPSKDQE